MTSSIGTSSSRSSRVRLAAGALTLLLAGAGLAACSSDSGSDSTTSAFCDVNSSLSLDSSLDDIDSSDLAGTVTKLQEINGKIKNVKAPDEIASDWGTVQTFFADFTGAFDGVDLSDDTAVTQAFADVSTKVQGEVSGMSAAGEKIDAFVKKNCS